MKMKKRLLSILLILCMVLSMVPVGAVATEPEEALYAQMLELGLIDADGTLIQDNSFTLEDHTRLSSLEELIDWLNRCGPEDLDTRITVDATGKTAAAEQLMYALSIEYQIAGLAEQLNLLAAKSEASAQSAAASQDTTAHDLELRPTVTLDSSTDTLTLEVLLCDRNREGARLAAPHDVTVQVGVFSDFLSTSDQNFAAGSTQDVPGANYFKGFTIPQGKDSVVFSLDLNKLRANYLAEHEGLWDGNAYLLFQARTTFSKMPASSFSLSIGLAPSDSRDPIVGVLTGDTLIGRKNGSTVQPYHLDWSQHNSATEKVSIDGKDYFKINTAVPAAKGSSAYEDPLYYPKYGWMESFRRAIDLGVGDPGDLRVKLENVTIWTKESNSIQFPSLSVMQNGELVKIASSPFTYNNDPFTDGSRSAAYLADLARVQETDWDYANPSNLNFYKKIKNHTWHLARFVGTTVPVSKLGGNTLSYTQDWYVNADWITQNSKANLRPEELLIHGALTIADKTAPTVSSIDTCAQDGKWYTDFYPGNTIPIVVTFSEPVYGQYELVCQVGTETRTIRNVTLSDCALFSSGLRKDEDTLSNTRTFYYTVADTDCTGIQILGVKPVDENQCTDLYGNKFKSSTDGSYKEFRTTVLDGCIHGGELSQSFLSMTAEADSQDPGKVHFQVRLRNVETFQTKWLEWSNTPEEEKDIYYPRATVVLDGDPGQSAELHLDVVGSGSRQEYVLVGSMDLADVAADTVHVAELYFGSGITDSALCYGIYGTFTQQPIIYADSGAYTVGVDGAWPSGADNVVFLQDAEVPVFDFTANAGASYTYQYLGTDDLTWTVSDPGVLQLVPYAGGGRDLTLTQSPKVAIVPQKAGTATVSLVCGNNGKRETTASNSVTVTVKDSSRPSLLFPKGADTVYARVSTDQTVHFASNLSAYGPADGKISAKLYAGSSVSSGDTPVWETELDRGAASLTLPGSVLTRISKGGDPAYVLRLTATAAVDGASLSLGTEAKIVVRSLPAVITLTGLEDPMFLSGRSIDIGWAVENFDLAENPDQCQFQFLVEKDGQVLYSTTEPSSLGSYTLTPDTPTELKDYYVVTAKAKNGDDPTWSIASSTVTVYRDGALEILVGGQAVDSVTLQNEIAGKTTTDPTIHTYSGSTIDGLASAQAIAGLRSELSLMESIGINFEEYDWSILYDAIQWSTSTGQGEVITDELQRAVTINYREGSLYGPLEQYSYTRYLPQTLLLLCGLRNGSSIVTASHASLPSLRDSVTVHVELLKDRLYLFQFSPAVRTEVSYEDGLGNSHTVYSNDDGSLALFEPNGIASELRAAAVSGGVSYRGTVSPLALKSGEGNGIRGELYPLNAVELRRAAVAQITLLKPDGTPLANSEVTLRGGVYRNRYAAKDRDDAYCAGAMFARSAGQAADLDGKVDQTFTTDSNGVLTVHMDLSQFTSSQDPESVGVGDSLEFIFELRFDGKYEPEIVTVDGSLTPRDAMRSGEDVVPLVEAQTAKPFVAVQTIRYTGREIDVRRHTGVVGPSSNYPTAVLESTLMLWGVEDASLTDTGYHFDLRAQETGVSVPDQQPMTAKDASYPFSSIPLVHSSVTLSGASFARFDGTKKTPLEAALYDGSDRLACTVALPFGLADLTAIEKVEDAPSVMSLLANVAAYGTVGGANTQYEYVNKVSDGVMLNALSFLEKMGGETGLVKAVLMPTEDPTRYEAYLWTGINTTKLGDLDYDQNGISIEPSYIGQDYDSLLGQVNDTFTLSDFQAMADGSYFDDRSGLYGAASGAIGLPIMLQLEGWMRTEIRYNFEKGQWQVLTTGGGFTAGAQLEFEHILNGKPYGIPLTASFKVRGGATVDFQTAVRYARQLGLEWNDDTAGAVNDYLTALRINAYFEFFGGLGYDKGFTAKVGVFGSIEINNENRFLTRKYLKNPDDRGLSGQFLQLDGEAGIRAALGVGPLVTEITLVSIAFNNITWSFNDWTDLNDYWAEASSGLGSTGWLNPGSTGQGFLLRDGQTAVAASAPVVKLQSRDYLAEGGRAWLDDSGISLMSLDDPSSLRAIETNSYPFSTPMLSDDGSILVYLSDADSTDVTDVEVRYSLSNGGSFPNGTAIPDPGSFTGYGDSSLDFDGTADFAGAVWLREAATVGLKAGTELNEGQQTALLNGLEVVASIWDGSGWSTARLTENGSQDFDPVIAVNGKGQAIAAWRSVQVNDTAFDFSQNRILCKIYQNGSWSSETYTLYNGSAGEVTGMSAELLEDGTAAIAFSVTDGQDTGDIYYTVLDAAAAAPEDSAKTIRATAGGSANEGPQLTTVGDRFVLGWSSVQSVTGATRHDVGLRVFDRTGAPLSVLPESLGDMVSTASFDGKFTFVKGAGSLDTLSVLWNDANSGDDNNDVIRAIRFGLSGGSCISSAPIEVAQLPARTGLDHMDACVASSDGTGILAVLQGTTSSDTDFESVSYSYELDGVTYSGTGRIPKQTVGLYSAAAAYSDSVEVVSTLVDFTTLAADSYIPVSFTVANQGMNPIDRVTITLEGAEPQTFSGLHLLPGQTKTLSAIAKTGAVIQDLRYTVEADFENAASRSASGTVYLDYPDVGISALTVTKEQDGERTVLVRLYNQSAASLDRSDRRVVLGVYSDPECQAPVNGTYFADGTPGEGYETILTGSSLASLDSTGDTRSFTFRIGDYVRDAGLLEIPDSGVTLFVKARIEQQINGQWTTLPEADSRNNQKYLTFDSLLTRNDGTPVTLSVEMENGSVAAAKVQIRSNSLQPTTSGNLLAALLDETGALLETQKIGNLSLGAEALQERSVTFSQPGARVVLRYGEAVSDGDSNADAASITLEGLPLTLANFDETDHAELENVEPGSYLLTVVPAADGAAVAVNGKPVENGMTAVKLGFLDRTLTIVVTSPDGSASRTYTLSLKVAPWSLVWYDLTFETNGGSEIPPLRTLAEVTVVLSAYEPTRKGYAFTGWFADAALTQPVTEIKLTGNTTVYAGWKDIRVCPFTDVTSDSYYYEAVLWAAEENIAKGTTPTTFSPNATCTRAQAVAFLWRAAGSPEPKTAKNPFVDVSSGDYFYKAVLWAVENGIVYGTDSTHFSPSAFCTRAQVVCFLYRYRNSPGHGTANPFLDVEKGAYYYDAILWAAENGVVYGMDPTHFDPNRTCTRAQIVTILWNALAK